VARPVNPTWRTTIGFITLELRLANADALDAAINSRTAAWDGVDLLIALQAAGVAAGICESAQDRCDWDPQLRLLALNAWTTSNRIS
jgi:NADP-dependent 3-hydroxy acid dehydrogenase YdfG